MIVPLKKILLQGNYYIKCSYSTKNQTCTLQCSWTEESIILQTKDYPNVLVAGILMDLEIRHFCKKHSYPYDFVLWFIDDEEKSSAAYPIITSEENYEKIENLWILYHNMISDGATPTIVKLASESHLLDDVKIILNSYLGVNLHE